MQPYELLQIELNTACNAKCKMCPRDSVQRGFGVMDETTFWNGIEQAHELGVRTVLPFINGEPLADGRMIALIELLAHLYPDVEVGWYTNGSLLTLDKAERLLKAGNIHHFNISMQGGEKATYESVTGLEWERTLANVEAFLTLNEKLGRLVEPRMNMCVFGPTAASVEAFRERWKGRATICLGAFSNFGGLAQDAMGEAPWQKVNRHVCDRATKHIYIYWNGDVGQCCFDLSGSIVYGNIKQTPLKEILKSDSYTAMQQAHRTINVPAMPKCCQACNSCKFHG